VLGGVSGHKSDAHERGGSLGKVEKEGKKRRLASFRDRKVGLEGELGHGNCC